MFDIDKINLQVALSRKLSGEDELRVKLLQKLSDGTKAAVDEAARYADVLKVIEDGQITTAEVESLAKKWGITTTEVLLYLRVLFAANEELRKMLGLLDEINKKKISQGIQQVQATTQKIETFIYTTALESTKGLNTDISKFLSQFSEEWSNYYKNLNESDIRKVLDINNLFSSFEFQYNPETCDLYFWGVKK
jgi:methylphosphotriester-DNA--protein-cysteine methyltransferase